MVGQTLGHYKILDKLGAGGMGEVYRAEDTTLDREVALKILPPELAESQERLDRFQREAKTLAALDHPNIVHIYTVEEHDGVRFLTMQLVEGKPLSQLISKGGMPLEQIFEIAIPLADALATAHEKGVIHRDLKPANVMVTGEGRVKVLDFGLAKLRQESEVPLATELPTEPLTKAGMIVGTMPYMSPEQLEGKEIDARSDIFSLGVVLYEMATGQRPFSGDTSISLISSIVKDRPVTVDTLREELPHHLARVIAHCLEKNPKRRYQSAIDVHNELDSLKKEIESGVLRPSSAQAERIEVPQSRRRWSVVAGVVITALVAVIAAVWVGRSRAPTANGRQIKSLAVLPLRDLSGNPEQEYFAEGMTEALITNLSKISALKVISRTSVMRYKETEKPIPEIADELGVDAIVEGSVLLSGDQVRITAQLIDGRIDQSLWAEDYTRELEDVLALHSEVAEAIVEKIQIAVTSEEARRLTSPGQVDPQALQAYLKGQYFWNQRTVDGFDQALEFFQRAIDIEPGWALAHAGLANTFNMLGEYGQLDGSRAYEAAEAAAEKAIELDETLAEAQIALAWVRLSDDWDWSAAERLFRRAIELNPSSALAHHWYAELLSILRRHEEAIAEIRRAQELDPLSLITNAVAGRVLHLARRHEEAIEELRRVLDTGPDFAMAHGYLGTAYAAQGMYQEAVAEWEISGALFGDDLYWEGSIACAYAAMGRRDEATEMLEMMSSRTPPPNYQLARLTLALGDRDEALTWLEKALEARAPMMPYLATDYLLDPLHGDPRFQDLLRRMNFPVETLP